MQADPVAGGEWIMSLPVDNHSVGCVVSGNKTYWGCLKIFVLGYHVTPLVPPYLILSHMFPSKFLQFPSILTHFHAANEKIQNGGRDLAISRGLVWVNLATVMTHTDVRDALVTPGVRILPYMTSSSSVDIWLLIWWINFCSIISGPFY